MRVLICDDEPLARQRLDDLLRACEGVQAVGAANNGIEALEQVDRHRPDLLLLDIEMPRLDGFDVVERLARNDSSPAQAPPLIVFATAFPKFAVAAFESGALDFLTKPIRQSRLEKALQKARRALEQREGEQRLEELSRQLEQLRANHRQPDEARHLWVQRRGEMYRLNLDTVDWVRAEGEYVRLHVGSDSYLHRDVLSTMMKQLDPVRFLRVHRSFAVNLDRVSSVRRSTYGDWKLVLTSGPELPIGRTYRQEIRARLSL
jgi:DNA-binding LytR/AlgR family response regulator